MIKILKYSLRFLFMLALVLSNFTYTDANSSTAKIKKAYESYMEKYPDNYNSYYRIEDIDKNGIPELLFHSDNKYILCTYDTATKKVIILKNITIGKDYDSCFQYNKLKKQVYISVVTTKTNEDIFVKVNGKKASIAKKFKVRWDVDSRTNTIDGKKVSDNVYEKKLKKALAGFKTVK